jgi:cystathionine beta-lyase
MKKGSPVKETEFAELELGREFLFSRTAAKWCRYPSNVIPSWIAEMDFLPPEVLQDSVMKLVSKRDYGYPRRPLMPAERQIGDAFAHRMGEHFGWKIEETSIQAVTDLLQGTIAAILAFSEAGEHIAVHTPCYSPFREAIEEAGRKIVEIPMLETDAGFFPDMDELRNAPADTRMFILCNPQNPTGRVFTCAELEEIAAIAEARDMIIFSDEVHADFVYDSGKHIPIASLGERVAARTMTANSPGKSFNIAGLRCGVIHFGTPELLARFRARIPRLLLGRPSAISVDAAVAAWTEGQPWLDRIVALLDRNRQIVFKALSQRMPQLKAFMPEASFLAWIDCRALGWQQPAATVFLEKARIAFSSGESFCARHDGFVRLNFATSEEVLREKLERMEKLVNAH